MVQIGRVTHIYSPLTSSDLKEELYSICITCNDRNDKWLFFSSDILYNNLWNKKMRIRFIYGQTVDLD